MVRGLTLTGFRECFAKGLVIMARSPQPLGSTDWRDYGYAPLRPLHYEVYLYWIKYLTHFENKHHPQQMGILRLSAS